MNSPVISDADRAACLRLVEQVLAVMPHEPCATCGTPMPCAAPNRADLRQLLANVVADGFDFGDLVCIVSEKIGRVDVIREESGAIVIDFVEALQEYPFRARFRRWPAGWRMESLCEACPACFAERSIDGTPCILCEGEGFLERTM